METEPKKSLSELEFSLLRYLANSDGMSARQVAEGYGEEHGYAPTTIMTLMERLRKKRYVTREKPGSVFIYQSALSQSELTQSVIKQFVILLVGESGQAQIGRGRIAHQCAGSVD